MGFSVGVVAEGALEFTAADAAAASAAYGGATIGGAAAAGGGTSWAVAAGPAAQKIGVSFAVSYALANVFNRGTSIANPDAQTFLGNGYSNVDPIPVLYGQRRIGGSRAVVAVRSSPEQTNDILALVVIWGEGELQALKTVYFDSVPATDASGTPIGIYSGYLGLAHHLGTDAQAVDAQLMGLVGDASVWSEKCTLAGIAYTYLALGWTPDRFPNGRPTITVDYQGRKLYDPRTGLTVYSRNAALAIRDFLASARYGCRVPSSMIDDTSFSSAANTCDELVTVPNFRLATLSLAGGGSGYVAGETIVLAGGVASRRAEIVIDTVNGSGAVLTFHISEPGSFTTTSAVFSQYAASSHQTGVDDLGNPIYGSGSGATFSGGTFSQDQQARYTCDGVVNVDQTPMDNMRALLMSCRGILVFSGGQYRLRIDKAETPVSFVLNADNIVGGWQIQLGSKHNRFNRVKARFFNEDAGYNPDYAIWPAPDPVTGVDLVGDAYRALDGGIVLETQIDLPFCTSIYRAQQICQIELKRSRFNLMVSLVATIAATCLEVGDVVPVAHATPGWPAAGDPAEGKLFRVVEVELLNNDEVRLVLLEYSAAAYTLDSLNQVVQASLTSLPDASSAAAPGTPSVTEALYETTGSAGVKSRAIVSWGASADVFVTRGGFYELEYMLSSASSWTRISPISATTLELDDLAAGVYDFRVRAVNSVGAHSEYSGTTRREIFGLTAAPSDAANFAVQAYDGKAKFTWDKPTANNDLDVVIGGRAVVRWSPLMVGAAWNDGSLINPEGYPGDTTIGFGPLMTGTYLLKFEDSSGNLSANPASFVVTEALLTGLTTIATLTEHPAFTGAKTNVAAVDGALKLDGTTLWDSIAGSIDSWGMVDTEGGVQVTGSYAFSQKLDLGSLQNVRIGSTIRSLAFDTADNWDDRTGNIDDWGLVDGDLVDDVEVTLYTRITGDDPNGSPSWGAWHRLGFIGDYSARGFDFRLDFASADPTHNRSVDQLVITARQ